MTRYRIDYTRRSNVSVRVIDAEEPKPIHVFFDGGLEPITEEHKAYVEDLIRYCPAILARALNESASRRRCLDIRYREEEDT